MDAISVWRSKSTRSLVAFRLDLGESRMSLIRAAYVEVAIVTACPSAPTSSAILGESVMPMMP
jgi:hypothetical protein